MKFSKQQSGYVSEISDFIADLKKKDPSLESKQLAGRALLWDKSPIDLDATRRAAESRIAQAAYVYKSK
ncbi:MAG: DUF3460 family protein [Burkholderiaceae bacterium]